MQPDEYRKYEIDIIKQGKFSGLGIAIINKNELSNIKRTGFNYPVTLYNSFKNIKTNGDATIVFCQFIIFKEADADMTNKNEIIINNNKSIVIVGYLNEYKENNVSIWSPCKSIKTTYKHFNDRNILIGFHGTDLKAAKEIKLNGFREFHHLRSFNIPANYFTPYIWYAYNWAYFNGQKGVIFVCLISLDHPMPKRSFESVAKIKDEEERHRQLLNKVADKKYDGINLEDEIWVWNPKKVIIVGEITS